MGMCGDASAMMHVLQWVRAYLTNEPLTHLDQVCMFKHNKILKESLSLPEVACHLNHLPFGKNSEAP